MYAFPSLLKKESEAQSSQELQELRLKNASLEKELAHVKGGYEEELERILKQVYRQLALLILLEILVYFISLLVGSVQSI